MTESSPSTSSNGSLQTTGMATAAADKAGAQTASRLLQSRVGREMQRYDGATRLLACVVVLRRAAGHTQKQKRAAAAPGSTCSADESVNDADGAQHADATLEDRVLVISSSKHPSEWILPKGGWESDETLVECALREAEEEAGVRIAALLLWLLYRSFNTWCLRLMLWPLQIAGEVVRELGALDFVSKNGKHCRFHGFQLSVHQEFQTWAESDRQRKWVSVADARLHLWHRPELLTMLERATG